MFASPLCRFSDGSTIMGPTNKAKTANKRGKGKYARMPLKSEGIKALVAVRKDVNPVILERRLRLLSPADFKLFQKLARITPSRARQMRKKSMLSEWKEWCLAKFRQLANESGATPSSCSLKTLGEAFKEKFGFKRSAATLSRYVGPHLMRIKPAGTYRTPSNDPTFHYKLQSLGRR